MMYAVHETDVSQPINTIPSIVCEYSTESKAWNTWKFPLDRGFFGSPAMVATTDGRYVISFGYHEGVICDLVFGVIVHDLKTNTFTNSALECPSEGYGSDAVIMANKRRDELLTCGFIKQSFQVVVLPHDLIQLISTWFCNEEVHLFWLNRCRSFHWKLDIDDILLLSLSI